MDEPIETPGLILPFMAAKKTTARTPKKASTRVPPDKPRAKMGRPLEMRGPLGELAEALGGRRSLAEAIGVAERSVSRWAAGDLVPPRPTRLLLAQLALANRIEPPYSTDVTCPRPAWLDDRDEDDD